MNKVFEKILKKIEEKRNKYQRLADSSNFDGWNEEDIKYSAKAEMCEELKEIVQEVAGKYNGGWISVKDRLPDKAGSYLVIGKSGGATVTRWYMPSEYYPEGHFGGNNTDWVRYWMPRPEPPKERD